MKRIKLIIAIAALGLFCAAILIFYGNTFTQQHTQQLQEKQNVKNQTATYSCPMHAEVTSDKPGKCSKCGMNLVLREEKNEASYRQQEPAGPSPKDKIEQVRSLLTEAKKELAQDGKYSCCINTPCNICAFEHQSCDCYKDLKAKKAVCNECFAGWQRGDGADKEIKASHVKTSYKKHSH